MQKKSINLLHQRGAPPTFWEKAYDWVSNTARIIVIVVEVVILGAFGARFWLDRQLKDLKGEIEIKGETLKSLADQEDEIRQLQDEIFSYDQIWINSSNYYNILIEVNGYLNSDIDKLSYSFSREEGFAFFSISGIMSRQDIDTLENDLKDSDTFSDVALANIQKKGSEDEYEFNLNATIVNPLGREALSQNEN